MNVGAEPTELGRERIGKLLIGYAVPGIIAMTASSLYNMVDSIFIGHIPEVGALAISGIAVTFPISNLSAALGTLVGVGASTLISILLGQRKYREACDALSNELTWNLIIGVVFSVLTLTFLKPILILFGATSAILPYAMDYMRIILLGNVVTHMYFGLNAVIRSSGNPKLAMKLTLFTVIANTVLDPILIFVFNMGVKGAAIATIFCQVLAAIYSFRYFLNRSRLIHVAKGIFSFNWSIAKKCLSIGLSPFLLNAAACVVAIFVNQQLGRYGGDLHIGAYGIVYRISFLFIMIVMGLNQGMQPIAGYNFGARQYSRVRKVFYLSAFWASIVTVLGFIISMFPVPAVSLFTPDEQLKAIAIKGMRCMNIVFPIIGFQMVSTNLFQCLGMVRKSIFLSLSRQLLLLLPCIYILPQFIGVRGVWYGFPISDGLSCILTSVFIFTTMARLKKMKDGDEPSKLGHIVS